MNDTVASFIIKRVTPIEKYINQMESQEEIALATIPVIIHEPSSPDERMFASRSNRLSQKNITNKDLAHKEKESSQIIEMDKENDILGYVFCLGKS